MSLSTQENHDVLSLPMFLTQSFIAYPTSTLNDPPALEVMMMMMMMMGTLMVMVMVITCDTAYADGSDGEAHDDKGDYGNNRHDGDRDVPKIKGTFFGVLIIRILLFRVLY